MLQSIRDKTQGWIAGVIISLVILSFAFWGIHSYLTSGSASNVAAKVNGTTITQNQFSATYDRIRNQFQRQFSQGYASDISDTQLKQQALQSLISIQVLKQASVAAGFMVTNHQIDSILLSMPEFRVAGHFSKERFQQMLATSLYTPTDFIDLIKTKLLIDQPQLGIVFSSFSMPNEVSEAMALVNQVRNVSYVAIPEQHFPSSEITISESQAKDYYTQHQANYKTPEQVSVEYIALTMKDIMDTIHPTDQELKTFYNDNINSYAQPGEWKLAEVFIPLADNASPKEISEAQAKIEDLVQQVKQGVEFVALAQRFPDAKKTNLDSSAWVSLNQVNAELQKSVAGLHKVGQIAGPLKISRGFVLLKVLDIRNAQMTPYEEVQDRVAKDFVKQQAEQKFADYTEQLDNVAYEHPDSLAPAAQKLNLKVQNSSLFTAAKGGSDLTSSKKLRDLAFSDDVLLQKNNSKVIQLNPETAVVLRMKSHVPASVLPFSTVQKQIVDKLKAMAAEDKAAKLADEMQSKLQADANPQELAGQYNLSWHSLGTITRHAPKVDSAISDAAFHMPHPQDDKPVYAAVKMSDGYAVVALKSVQDGAVKEADSDEYQVFSEQVQNSLGLLDFELYKLSLMNHAKIVVENTPNNSSGDSE